MEYGYWFTSDLFIIQKGEDEETNPGCYGKELANWIYKQLEQKGYEMNEVIPEDWGWCVMTGREDYMLWIGCGSMQSDEVTEAHDPNSSPCSSDIVWHIFPHAEAPIFFLRSFVLKLLGKMNPKSDLNRLNNDLKDIIENEPRIHICDEP